MDETLNKKYTFYLGRVLMLLGIFLFFLPVLLAFYPFLYQLVSPTNVGLFFMFRHPFVSSLVMICLGQFLAPIQIGRPKEESVANESTVSNNEMQDVGVDRNSKSTSYTDPTYRNFFYAYLVALVCCSGMHLIFFPLIPFYIAMFPIGLANIFIPITGASAQDEMQSAIILVAAIYTFYFYLAYAGVARGSKTVFAAFAFLLLLNVIGCRILIDGMGRM